MAHHFPSVASDLEKRESREVPSRDPRSTIARAIRVCSDGECNVEKMPSVASHHLFFRCQPAPPLSGWCVCVVVGVCVGRGEARPTYQESGRAFNSIQLHPSNPPEVDFLARTALCKSSPVSTGMSIKAACSKKSPIKSKNS